MRVLVTGGAGFIGSHLVERLVKDGHDVLVMDDLSTGSLDNLKGVIDPNDTRNFQQDDIRDYSACEHAMRDVEVVFHQAALGSVPRSVANPHGTHEANVTGTLNLLEAARRAGVERFIYASSSSVYGEQLDPAKHENMCCEPTSPYGVSKLAAERYCSAYWSTYKLPTISLRYFNVYGPRQNPDGPYAAVIPLFIQACRQSEPLTIYGDGRQTRDFTFVADVVEANMLAMTAKKEAVFGSAINVACGRAVEVWHLARVVDDMTREVSVPTYKHNFVAERPGDVKHSLAHVNLLVDLLGFDLLKATKLSEGLRATVEWFKTGAPC